MILILVADIVTIILMFANKKQFLNAIGVWLCCVTMFKINRWPGFPIVLAVGLIGIAIYLINRKGKGTAFLLWLFFLPVFIHFISASWDLHFRWSWLLLFLSVVVFIQMAGDWKTYRTEFIWMTIPFIMSVQTILHKFV
jgi:hypothetical protein